MMLSCDSGSHCLQSGHVLHPPASLGQRLMFALAGTTDLSGPDGGSHSEPGTTAASAAQTASQVDRQT